MTMEEIHISLNEPDEYARRCHGTTEAPVLKDAGALHIATLDGGSANGAALACLSFTVEIADGKFVRAQTVTTVKLLVGLLHILRGRYGHDGIAQPVLTPEQLTNDVMAHMPDDIRADFLADAIRLAVYKIPGQRLTITPPRDQLLIRQLHLKTALDPETMTFTIDVKRKS